jgi:hypothetical protein
MKHTARNVVLQIGSLVALYVVIGFLLNLIFSLITVRFPSDVDTYWKIEDAVDAIRFGIAGVIVFFPAYLLLTRYADRARTEARHGEYYGVTKWLVYLSLLVGGFTLLATFVGTIYEFLNGDITIRFVLKALALTVVIGITCYYYVYDIRGDWAKRKIVFYGLFAATVMSVVAVLTIAVLSITTPTTVREMRLDQIQLQDLQLISNQIDNFTQLNDQEKPKDLAELAAAVGAGAIPEPPEGRDDYTYEPSEAGYKLCATFAHDDKPSQYFNPASLETTFSIWSYKRGRYCFQLVHSCEVRVEKPIYEDIR